MSKGQGEAVAKCNYVAQDQIWKDHIKYEHSASKKWPENWHFLTTKYEDLVADQIPHIRKQRPEREIPTPLRLPPITPTSHYLQVGPSPRPVPMTTARSIGWRSTVPELALERYGRYAKPKGGLVRQLNWPPEAID